MQDSPDIAGYLLIALYQLRMLEFLEDLDHSVHQLSCTTNSLASFHSALSKDPTPHPLLLHPWQRFPLLMQWNTSGLVIKTLFTLLRLLTYTFMPTGPKEMDFFPSLLLIPNTMKLASPANILVTSIPTALSLMLLLLQVEIQLH